jgi:hypothetical protein
MCVTHACLPSGLAGVTLAGIDVLGAAPTTREPPCKAAMTSTHAARSATMTTSLYRVGQYQDCGPTRSPLLLIGFARAATRPSSGWLRGLRDARHPEDDQAHPCEKV